jgi:hypothetical protein
MSDKSIAAPAEIRKPTNPRFIDLEGQTFDRRKRLKVIEYRGSNKDHHALWLCECSCGNTKVIIGSRITKGLTQSCGCLHRETLIERQTTHGDTHTRLYNIYNLMIFRCNNKKATQYKDYGGRGIKVCDEWLANYDVFRDWAMGHGYREDLTIERDDVNGNYESGNCSWIPRVLQPRNTRKNRRLTALGETKPLASWVEDPRCLAGYRTIMSRIHDGWDEELAIITPRLRPPRGVRKSKPVADC